MQGVKDEVMDRICKHCGLTYGQHHGGTSPWPRDYCPGHKDKADWENGPGTIFKDSGKFKRVEDD